MLKSKSGIIRTYDSIAPDFDETRYKPWPDTIEFAKRFDKGDLILDLGCGNGRDLRHFESVGLNVAGVDISMGQLKVVKQRAEAPPMLVRGDVCSLPFKDETADGAILVATLHHLPTAEERSLAVSEVWRSLVAGGKCLVGVWAREQPKFVENMERARNELGEDWEPGDMLLDWKMPDGRVFPRYYHLFSEEEFSDLLTASDFEVERKYFSCDNHYAILSKN